MRSVVLILLVLVALLAQPAAGLAGLVPVPPNTLLPTDPDGDGKYEDLNANARKDFADVVLYFNQMAWIAANEPLSAFDYNGNSRIDFADVVSLFNELGSGPTPTPTGGGSVSQVVNPSDADQTVRLDASTAVIIPGGLLTAPQTVTIERVPSPPSPTRDGDQVLNAVRVSIGTLHTFSQELPIEMPFDPSTVPSGTDPASIIQGAYWDTETGAWVPLPSTVDTARRVVTVYTTHLSLIGDLRTYMNLPSVEGVHFLVHYDPNDDGFAKAYDAAHTFANARAMATHCAAVLDSAYADYTGQGFRPPVPGFLDVNRIRVFVGQYEGDAFWSGKTGRIYVPVVPDHFERGVGGLDMELRHELFHAVQNRYWTTWTMAVHRWWTEATAEYASGVRPQLPPTYVMQPLTYDPDIDDQHKYQTATFITEMISKSGLSFQSIWAYPADHTGVYASLDTLLRNEGGTTLSAVYRNFALSRVWKPDVGNKSYRIDTTLLLDGEYTTMDVASDRLERRITIPAEGTTRIWGVKLTGLNENGNSYLDPLFITVPGGLPEGVTLDLGSPDLGPYNLLDGGDGKKPRACIEFANIYDTPEEHLYLILTNTGTSERTVTILVSRPVITWIPSDPVGGREEMFPIQVVVEQIPEGIETVKMSAPFDPVVRPVNNGRVETTITIGAYWPGNHVLDVWVWIPYTSQTQWPPDLRLRFARIPYRTT